ncbi:hypothetical protein CFE70_009390 [Pyrenophora teres f. teres 0-1]
MASAAEVQQSPELYNATGNEKGDVERRGSVAKTEKGRWERLWPVIACGAGLFSDGYLNNIIGPVNTMLKTIYPESYKNSSAQANVSSITFAGTVVGMLFFGYTSDHFSRKWSLFTSTIIIILFAILGTASYGAGGSPSGLLTALVVYRFFLGIGIGGEYPAGSVGCAESTGELRSGTRNKWFILFTNVQIDLAFFLSAIVATVVVLATGEQHLRLAWRICLGIGVLPPLSLMYLRLKLQEPEAFQRESLAKAKTPWWLIIKFYWFRLGVVSVIWFIYDFSAYSFGIYATSILANLLGDSAPLWKSLAWNILINFFYMPGCLAGAFVADLPSMGPKRTLAIGVVLQGIIGFIMAGGQYYGIAAAVGKIGAFAGSYALDAIQTAAGDDKIAAGRNPFYVASTLAFVAAGLVFLLPDIGQDTIDHEDVRFRDYLTANGYDTGKMGLSSEVNESVEREGVVPVEKVEGK